MNKPNKISLSEYRRTLLKSADGARADRLTTDSDSPSMYYLGVEVAFLIAAAHTERIDVNKPAPLSKENK